MDEQKLLLASDDVELDQSAEPSVSTNNSEEDLRLTAEEDSETDQGALADIVPARWARQYTLGLLLVTTACLYTDQNLLAPNLSAIASDFGLSDTESML
jgi:hypothetical protein